MPSIKTIDSPNIIGNMVGGMRKFGRFKSVKSDTGSGHDECFMYFDGIKIGG